MRLSEFAKTLGLPAGILLAKAKQLELEVSSTLSSLDDSDIAALRGWTDTLSAEDRERLLAEHEASRKSRKAKGEQVRLEEVRKNREAVEAHRRIALDAEAGKPMKKVEMPVEVAPVAPVAAPAAPEAKPEVKVEAKPEVKPETKPEAEVKVEAEAQPEAPAKPAEPAKAAKAPAATKAPAPAPKKGEAPKAEQPKEKPTLKPTLTPTLKPTAQRPSKPEPARPVSLGLSPTKAPNARPNKEGQRNDRNDRNADRNAGRNGRDNRRQQEERKGNQPSRGANDRNNRKNVIPPRVSTPAPTAAPAVSVEGKTLQLQGPVTVKELAELLGTRPNLLITDLMKLNVLASINQTLELGIVQKIAEKYGYVAETAERAKQRSAERKPQLKSEDADDDIPEDRPEDMKLRPPVVTFLGHVDHGKTTLMDYIRSAHVAAGEAGGITQHIAAYTIELDQRDDNGNRRLITFVDTPGHSAFESMRARGANITDIAVIIVAADDGVMPQTREAIKHARNAGVQMLVAVTKCDKPEANPMRVYQMLQAEGLTPSTWGGDIECCEVSGTTGAGVEDLLETILIQADVLELQANPNRRANGAVIESQLEQGLGPTATFLVQGGTLKVGDVVLCGEHYGKVRTLIDERGKPVKSAGPSIAVKCTGLSGVPEAGSEFRVMLNEKRARALAEKAAEVNKLESLSAAQSASMADWSKKLGSNETAELNVIVKADTQGTAEAVVECLNSIESQKVSLKVLYSGVGSVTSADVQRAKGATIVGFGVNCEPGVQSMARQNGVRINTFRIIYELIEHVKRCMLELIPPEYKEVVRGHAEIRQIFDISKLGRIAGCQMLDGTLRFKGRFRIFRGRQQIFDGAVETMKHFKEDVKEIAPAQECGLGFGSFEAFQEGDIVECYEMEELPKSL
ncbi:MAG: translation initiation factor IF-2 [Kiritimatiellae bacterium]|nr:translation initiation factor IF-2 [Kiritimatiellia bacterium]